MKKILLSTFAACFISSAAYSLYYTIDNTEKPRIVGTPVYAFSGVNEYSSIKPFPTIVFHEITKNKSEVQSTVVTLDEFERHMKSLKDNGYNTITDEDINYYIYGNIPLPKNPIHITFDDGYESNYSLAFPVLKKLNMKATVFPISGAINDPNYVSDRKILTWDHIKEMSDSGLISIQNHTDHLHHKVGEQGYEQSAIAAFSEFSSFKSVAKTQIYTDISKASKEIEEKTEKPVISLSYPFGTYDSDIVDAVKASGVTYAYTLSGKLTDFSKQGRYELGRINIPTGLSDDEFLELISGK